MIEQKASDIEQLTLGYSFLRESRLLQDIRQKASVHHQPDGTSVPRPTYQVTRAGPHETSMAVPTPPIAEQRSSITQTLTKLPGFSDLEGPALEVVVDLSAEECCNLQAITAALNRRFGQ